MDMPKSTLKPGMHVEDNRLKKTGKIWGPDKPSQKYCGVRKEPTNLISKSSADIHQEEVWSNFAKWSTTRGRTVGGLTTSHMPSESETSSSLSTLELSTLSCKSEASTFSFTREREEEREPLTIYSCLESPHIITMSSSSTSKSSLPVKGMEKHDTSTDGYNRIKKTHPQTKIDNGHVANSSYPCVLHDGTSIGSPEIWTKTKKGQNKSPMRPPSGISSPTSKSFNKLLIPSENKSNIPSEPVVSRRPLSPLSERSGRFIQTNQEKNSENVFISTTETKHSHPRKSASSSPPNSQGLLHCICKDGLPYYTFSLNKSEQALVAKTCKLNCGREDFEWIYTFHSCQGNTKKSSKSLWMRKDKHTLDLDLVGWMRVSSSVSNQCNTLGNSQRSLETQFVLFGAGGAEHSTDSPSTQENIIQSLDLDHISSTTSSGNSSDLFSTPTPPSTRPSTPITRRPSTPIPVRPGSPMSDMMKKTRLDRRSLRQHSYDFGESSFLIKKSGNGNAVPQENWDNSGIMSEAEFCASQPCSPHLELSTIVIRMPLSQPETTVKGHTGKDTTFPKDSGGWGLKFLEKRLGNSTSKHATHQEKHDSGKSRYNRLSVRGSSNGCGCDEHSIQVSCVRQYETSVTAIVPAGVHGLPTIRSSRPSSLIERWKYGGRCDCGGWDLGCQIMLLHNQKTSIEAHSNSASNSIAQDRNSLYVLFKGGTQDTPALTMTCVHEGLYCLSFQSQLSVLQVFSICVALLHYREAPLPLMDNKSRNLSSSKSALRNSRQGFFPAGQAIGNRPCLRPTSSPIARS